MHHSLFLKMVRNSMYRSQKLPYIVMNVKKSLPGDISHISKIWNLNVAHVE